MAGPDASTQAKGVKLAVVGNTLAALGGAKELSIAMVERHQMCPRGAIYRQVLTCRDYGVRFESNR